MKVLILDRSDFGAHFAIMALIEGNVAPSQTPIKARSTITNHGKSAGPPAIVASGIKRL